MAKGFAPTNQYAVIERVLTEVSRYRALTTEESDVLDIVIRAQQANRTLLSGHSRATSYRTSPQKEAFQHAML